MKISPGDVFRIPTKKGFGFLQFIEKTDDGLHYIRVLDHLATDGTISQVEVDKLERWSIEFALSAANNRKIVEYVGPYKISKKYKMAKLTRSKHIVGGEFLGWHIVNRKSLKRKLRNKLSNKEKRLSPEGIFNDTLIIEYLENDWSLFEWV